MILIGFCVVGFLLGGLLAGCFPIPEPPVEPVTSIYIEPSYSEISLGESIKLACYDQLDRPVEAKWSKRCGAGTLSTYLGETCIYTAPKTMAGIQIIYVEYEELKAEARVKGI
ncbi:MAG: hypothetical protein WD512_02305 [Candidatus Paceibacterota bacterium]